MPLLVGQLIYTSFPKVGFKSLASPEVPLEIQQSFLQQIVYRHWDTYNPPKAGYQAAYLYQFSLQQILFGWLYNDGNDDLGRSHIPYFIGYYLSGILSSIELERILNCLEKGPVEFIERENPPKTLEGIQVPDFCDYPSPRPGVRLSQKIHQQSQRKLEKQQLIALFVPLITADKATQPDLPPEIININSGYVSKSSIEQLTMVEPIPPNRQSIFMQRIEAILQELATKPIGIQGVVLVSSEGQLMTIPLGIDENSAQILAGTILYLAKSTQDELHWQGVESIALRAQEGHLILTRCDGETLLLIKSGKVLTGLLEGEINRTVKKLQGELLAMRETSLESESFAFLREDSLGKVDNTLSELTPELVNDSENEMRYRGRRTNF